MGSGRRLSTAFVGPAALVLACGGGSAAPQAPPTLTGSAPTSTSLTIVAEDLRYTPDAMSAPAGSTLSVRFENRDPGTPHDLALFSDAGRSIKLFGSAITTGVSTRDLSIPGLDPGTYRFACYVHPDMAARLTVGD